MHPWLAQTPSTHIELSSPEDVKQAMESVSRLMMLRTVHVGSKLIPEDDVPAWQARVDRHLAACGCRQSTLGMLALAVLYAALHFFRSGELGGIGSAELLSCAGFAVVGAAIGKLGGVAYARMRLKRTLEALLSVSQSGGIDRRSRTG
jgi:hypothetical protein